MNSIVQVELEILDSSFHKAIRSMMSIQEGVSLLGKIVHAELSKFLTFEVCAVVRDDYRRKTDIL